MKLHAIALLLVLLFSSTASAQEWASLTGKLLYDGAPPTKKEFQLSKTTRESYGLPADLKLYEESLIVDPKTKGIANIAVFAAPEFDEMKMPIHLDLLASKSAVHEIELLHMAFKPHLSFMHVNQTLVMTNNDASAHAPKINAPSASSESFIKTLLAKAKLEQKFDKPTRLPYTLSCAVQPYLHGYLFVRDNPYFAVTDSEGKFEIKNLPVGKWRFQFWHEKSGYVTKVKVGDANETWDKGRPEFEIPKEGKSLGEVFVSEANFKK